MSSAHSHARVLGLLTRRHPAGVVTRYRIAAADCIPGTWLLDSQTLIDSILAVADFPPGSSFAYESGTYDMVIQPDGTYTSTRVEWTISASTPGGSILIVFNAVRAGIVTWDDTFAEADEQTNTTSVQLYADVGGSLLSIPGGSAINTETLDAAAPYECVGGTLRLLAEGAGSTWHRQ